MERFPRIRLDVPDEEYAVRQSLEKIRKKEAKPVPGEREKTKWELEVIELIHQMHKELFSRFGLGQVPTFYDQQVHMVNVHVFANSLPQDQSKDFLEHVTVSPAAYQSDTGQIFVWETERLTKERYVVYLLYETLHLISNHVVQASYEKKSLRVESLGIGKTQEFNLINEAIIQMVVQVLCSEYKEEIEVLGIKWESVMNVAQSARQKEVDAWRGVIVPALSTATNIPSSEVLEKGVISFFTGGSYFIDMCVAAWGEEGVRALARCDMEERSEYTKAILACCLLPKEKAAICMATTEASRNL